jgi:hypothetical protein
MHNERVVWVLGACGSGALGILGFFAKTAVELMKNMLAELKVISAKTNKHDVHIDIHKTYIEKLDNNVEKLDARVSALENK